MTGGQAGPRPTPGARGAAEQLGRPQGGFPSAPPPGLGPTTQPVCPGLVRLLRVLEGGQREMVTFAQLRPDKEGITATALPAARAGS